MSADTPYRRPFRKGAVHAASLVARQIRAVGERKGFAVARLVTHWDDIVGADLARMARPVNVSYARGGMGGTLTVLCQGAEAPMVQMRAEDLRRRVNACYGYEAIRRVHITQTAATGLAEAPATYTPPPRGPSPAGRAVAEAEAAGVGDPDLRRALATLGAHVLSASTKGETP